MTSANEEADVANVVSWLAVDLVVRTTNPTPIDELSFPVGLERAVGVVGAPPAHAESPKARMAHSGSFVILFLLLVTSRVTDIVF